MLVGTWFMKGNPVKHFVSEDDGFYDYEKALNASHWRKAFCIDTLLVHRLKLTEELDAAFKFIALNDTKEISPSSYSDPWLSKNHKDDPTDTMLIQNSNGYCLDATNYHQVVLRPCDSSLFAQQWVYDTKHRFINLLRHQCLENTHYFGEEAVMMSCHNPDRPHDQKWQIQGDQIFIENNRSAVLTWSNFKLTVGSKLNEKQRQTWTMVPLE